MDVFDPGALAEKGIKVVVLSFVLFMHYICTGLIFFGPIDIAWKIFGLPQFVSILFGSFILYIWATISAWCLIKSYDKKGEKDE